MLIDEKQSDTHHLTQLIDFFILPTKSPSIYPFAALLQPIWLHLLSLLFTLKTYFSWKRNALLSLTHPHSMSLLTLNMHTLHGFCTLSIYFGATEQFVCLLDHLFGMLIQLGLRFLIGSFRMSLSGDMKRVMWPIGDHGWIFIKAIYLPVKIYSLWLSI